MVSGNKPIHQGNNMTRIEKANLVAAAINDHNYTAKVWEKEDHIRVYVSRRLSRRNQDMGYIEICEDGSINANGMSRAKATVESIAIAAVN